MSELRRGLLKLAHTNPELRESLVPLLASTRTAKKMTEKEWKAYKEKHPKAKKENHEISKSDSGGGADVPSGVDLSGVTPEQVKAFAGEIPEYKLEIIAGGEDGEVTEADLRRARAVKAQLKRGIQNAADVCKMSPPVCEDNFGVARSSMPQLSADESIKDMLKTDKQRIADKGDKWGSYSDEKKAKKKKRWATERKKGEAAVAAGADPNDDRTVFKQLLDSVAKEGTKIGSQKPPFEKVDVGQLKATQREIKAGKTYGIANAYLQGDYDPRESPIIISADNHILDGHHRYSAMITADPEAKMNVIRVDLPMNKFLERSFEQPGVFRADLQDNIISGDDPLDLARKPGSSWQQKGKWYGKDKDGEASGPFKDKDAAENHASGTRFAPEQGEKVEKKDKPKKKAYKSFGSRDEAFVAAVELADRRRMTVVLRKSYNGWSISTPLKRELPSERGERVEPGTPLSSKQLKIKREMGKKASKAPTLKGRLAKLAFDNPDMREALLPLLKESASSPLLDEIQKSMKRFISDVNRKFHGDGYKRTDIEAQYHRVEGSERGLGDWYIDWEDVEDDEDIEDYDYEKSSDLRQITKYFENWMKKEPWYNRKMRFEVHDGEKQWIYFYVQVR